MRNTLSANFTNIHHDTKKFLVKIVYISIISTRFLYTIVYEYCK